MPTKRDRDLIKAVQSLGYEQDRMNSKGVLFFLHPDTGASVSFPHGCDERRCRDVETQARHLIGLPTKDNKRNSTQIRERNAAEHAKAAADLDRAREQRDSVGASKHTESELKRIEELFLRAERRFQWWDRLMRGVG